MKKEDIAKLFSELQPFTIISDVPELPITDEKTWNEIVIPNLVRCGAIPKEQLKPGMWYVGSCRNSNTAYWDGKQFEYIRHKFGTTYTGRINHFEDDDKHDLFIPLKSY